MQKVEHIGLKPVGEPGPTLLMSGRWDLNKEYVRDSEVIPLVEHEGLFYSLNKMGNTQGGLNPKDDYAQHGNKATWKLRNSYEMVIVKALVAGGGLIGEFVFWDGKMMSQQGVDRAGNPSAKYEEFRSGNFIPNLLFDALTGNIIAIRGQFGLLYIIDGDIVGLGEDKKEVVRISSKEIPDSHLLDGKWENLELNRWVLDDFWWYDTTSIPPTTFYKFAWETVIDCDKIGEYCLEDIDTRMTYNSNGVTYKDEIRHKVSVYHNGKLVASTSFDQYGSFFFYADEIGKYSVHCEIWAELKTVMGNSPSQNFKVDIHSEIMAIQYKESPRPTTLLGRDGLYSSFTSSEYLHYKAGQGFTIKAGSFGLRISPSGIKKWNGNQWVVANI